MRKQILARVLLIMCLVAGLAVVRSQAEDFIVIGCTNCVRTDDGVYGCLVGSGTAGWCVGLEDGSACAQGGSCS